MRRTPPQAKVSKTSNKSPKLLKVDQHSSEFDLNKYQYRDVSCYSEDAFSGNCKAPSLRTILAKRQSTELLNAESMAQSPAKKGMLQLLKAKKLHEGPPVNMIEKVKKTRIQLETHSPTRTGILKNSPPVKDDKLIAKSSSLNPLKNDKSTPGAQVVVKGVEKKSSYTQLMADKSKQEAQSPESTQEKITAVKSWKTLRAVTRLKGLYSKVQKHNRYITVAQIKKQVKERQKKIPKLPKLKPVYMREKRLKIIVKPDRKIEKASSSKMTESIDEGHSESIQFDHKKRESFMVPSHQIPNISAIALPTPVPRAKKATKSVTVIVNPPTPSHSQKDEGRSRRGLSARNIFDDGKYMHIADHIHRERRRGGFHSMAADENENWDPPIRLSEALAAILLNLNEQDVVIVISPVQGSTLQNTSYLQVAVIERKRARVLGSFLIPADNALSVEEEEALGHFACLCISKDFHTFQEDMSPVLKYLSAESVIPPPGKTTENLRQASDSQPWTDPDKVFDTARQDGMTIFIRPDFLDSQCSMFACDFFTIQGSYMFSYNFTLDEIIMQWNKSPEHTNQFKVVTDVVDVMFPQPCLRKKLFRILESTMKLLRIDKAYDCLCYLLFEMYKRVF